MIQYKIVARRVSALSAALVGMKPEASGNMASLATANTPVSAARLPAESRGNSLRKFAGAVFGDDNLCGTSLEGGRRVAADHLGVDGDAMDYMTFCQQYFGNRSGNLAKE